MKKITLVVLYVFGLTYGGAVVANRAIDTVTSYRAMQITAVEAEDYLATRHP